MSVVASGSSVTSGEQVVPYGGYDLYVVATANAVININGHNISIPAGTSYNKIGTDVTKFTVVSGTIHWYATGSDVIG